MLYLYINSIYVCIYIDIWSRSCENWQVSTLWGRPEIPAGVDVAVLSLKAVFSEDLRGLSLIS